MPHLWAAVAGNHRRSFKSARLCPAALLSSLLRTAALLPLLATADFTLPLTYRSTATQCAPSCRNCSELFAVPGPATLQKTSRGPLRL